jgi:hypothetical protein
MPPDQVTTSQPSSPCRAKAITDERRLPVASIQPNRPLLRIAGHYRYLYLSELLRYYNSILFCGAILSIFLMLRRHIDARLLNRFLLLLVSGSMLATSLNDFYGETFTLVTVGVGVLAIVTGGRVRKSAGWTAVVLGAVNTPASLVGLAMLTGAQAVRQRRLGILAALFIGVGLAILEISLRDGGYVGSHGARSVMPYSGLPGFSYPFVLGVAAILFSFGRGLLYFFPGLALPARQRLREAAGPDMAEAYRLWMLFTGGLVIVYASWWAWHGGLAWGPRFFVIAALPASLAVAVRIGDVRASVVSDLITLLALTLSVWGAIASTVYFGLWPPQCYDNGIEELCHFAPEFSPLWYPFLARPPLDAGQKAVLAYYLVVFAWLALPVMRRLGYQGSQALSHWRASVSQWRI